MRIALYARVSIALEQNPENQLIELRRWAKNSGHEIVEPPFVDEISSRDTRPAKEEVLRLLRLGEIGGVAFVKFDRWGRTLSELILEMEEFSKSGKRLISLKEGFDLSTASGRAFAGMLAVFANFERDLGHERTLLGQARADAQGKIIGRHPKDCGCGKGGHNGSVKPLRDKSGRHTSWKYPDGTVRLRDHHRNAKKQTPPVKTPRCHE